MRQIKREMTEEILINISPSPQKKLRGKSSKKDREGRKLQDVWRGGETQEVHSRRHSAGPRASWCHYPKEGQRVKWFEVSNIDLLLSCSSISMPCFKKIWYLRTHIEKTGISEGNCSTAFVKCLSSVDKRSHIRVLSIAWLQAPQHKNLGFHKTFQEPICHIHWYIHPFACVSLSGYSVHLWHSWALLFTEALCLDISSLRWWRVCFLSNVTGRNSALTGGRGRNERLLAEAMEAAAPKRGGKNHLQFSPDMDRLT